MNHPIRSNPENEAPRNLAAIMAKPGWRWARFFRDIATDLILIAIALVVATGLAHQFVYPDAITNLLARYGLVLSGVFGLLLLWRGAHRINARYLSMVDFVNLALVVGMGSAVFALLVRLDPTLHSYPGEILTPILFGFISLTMLSGIRVLHRHVNWQFPIGNTRKIKRRRTMIVGAGDAGDLIVREMNRSSHSEHIAVLFVDDDPSKIGLSIHGVKVVGPTAQIPYLATEFNIDDIILAIPSADGTTMRRLVELCDRAEVRLRILPPVTQIFRPEHGLKYQLREVGIEDLLRREPITADPKIAEAYISAETVLVTGGGGSIGSELARQIARLSPANLVLVGKGENSVYEIEQELIQTLGFAPTCVIADVRDRQMMENIFVAYKPTVIFHAAAHKHVPLMQGNSVEAIKNNVFGTEILCDLAVRHGVRKFVYISTDKAVRPSSVMGATKRVGEIIVRSYAQRSETQFAIVRFGNVLGSRGSLVPVLERQIRRGGPVRLTHPDMTRYFMTIPEAVQLILQAGAMGSTAELFILDMGEPIKIVDLARDLIRLHGLVPNEDIEVQFTGVRPGEKTHEELVYSDEQLEATSHPKIRVVAQPKAVNQEWLRTELEHLRELMGRGNSEELRQSLMELAWGKSTVPYQFAAVDVQLDEAEAVATEDDA
ncbi:MAG: polysaccharide biosynthesis protein [Chthonomonas sp.]|nr:polysaccharide biosynthesis protein [Chthonomonas sp.]